MKTRLAVLALCAALPAWAQQPAPGLWETDWKTVVNGQDLGALMQRAMADAIKAMPAAQRAQAEQMMKEQANAFGGKDKDCLTPEEAARMADPQKMLAEMQKDAPHCRFEPVKVAGGNVSFKGRCNDPQGFSGDISGEFKLDGAKAWSGSWGGKGRLAGIEGVPGLAVPADGRVDYRASGSGRWLAASCGAVKPK